MDAPSQDVQVFDTSTEFVSIQNRSFKMLSFRKQIVVLDLSRQKTALLLTVNDSRLFAKCSSTEHLERVVVPYRSRTKQHHAPQTSRTAWSTGPARNLLKLPRISEDACRRNHSQMSSTRLWCRLSFFFGRNPARSECRLSHRLAPDLTQHLIMTYKLSTDAISNFLTRTLTCLHTIIPNEKPHPYKPNIRNMTEATWKQSFYVVCTHFKSCHALLRGHFMSC